MAARRPSSTKARSEEIDLSRAQMLPSMCSIVAFWDSLEGQGNTDAADDSCSSEVSLGAFAFPLDLYLSGVMDVLTSAIPDACDQNLTAS
jgi:hypothetical protein